MKATELLPITEKNASLTMSSREIAELTHKEHKNVLRVIRDLIEQNLVAQIEPLKCFCNACSLCKVSSSLLIWLSVNTCPSISSLFICSI